MIFSPKITIKTVNKASSSSVPKPKILTTLNTLHRRLPPNKTSKNFKICAPTASSLENAFIVGKRRWNNGRK